MQSPLLLSAFVGLYCWYRTFFDSAYVGLETASEVAWSGDTIRFQGAYFHIQAHINDIVEYKVRGLMRWDLYNLRVRIQDTKGNVQAINVRSDVRHRRKLVEYLEWAWARRANERSDSADGDSL
jgi:hypothetical protein